MFSCISDGMLYGWYLGPFSDLQRRQQERLTQHIPG